jgi:hypothetical protein
MATFAKAEDAARKSGLLELTAIGPGEKDRAA